MVQHVPCKHRSMTGRIGSSAGTSLPAVAMGQWWLRRRRDAFVNLARAAIEGRVLRLYSGVPLGGPRTRRHTVYVSSSPRIAPQKGQPRRRGGQASMWAGEHVGRGQVGKWAGGWTLPTDHCSSLISSSTIPLLTALGATRSSTFCMVRTEVSSGPNARTAHGK